MGILSCDLNCIDKKVDQEIILFRVTKSEVSNRYDSLNLKDNNEKYFQESKNNNVIIQDNNDNQDNKEKKYFKPIEEINNNIELNINKDAKIKNKNSNFKNKIEENSNEYFKSNSNKIKDDVIDDEKIRKEEIKEEKKEEIKEDMKEDIKEKKSESEFIKKAIISSPIKKNEEENEIEEQIDKNLFPEDDFSKYIFEHINLIRENPKYFIKEIKDNKSKIKKDKLNRIIFNSKLKVALTKGEEAFDKAIEDLETTEPMDKLIYFPELNIPLPENEDDLIKKNYLKEKESELKYNVEVNWKEIIKDPFICFLLMVVDDTKKEESMKRKCILDREIKYIGICSKSIGKNFCCYLTFANKLKKNQELLNN